MGSDAVVWRRAWQCGQHTIRLGECEDGRWLVAHSRGARLVDCWDERAACERVQRWMGRTRWQEVTGDGLTKGVREPTMRDVPTEVWSPTLPPGARTT